MPVLGIALGKFYYKTCTTSSIVNRIKDKNILNQNCKRIVFQRCETYFHIAGEGHQLNGSIKT
jgi:hypothetical protein